MTPRLLWLCLFSALMTLPFANRAIVAQESGPQKAKVYYLKHAQADELARTISALYADTKEAAGIKVVAESITNALLISAPDEATKQIEELLQALDAAAAEAAEAPKVVALPDIQVFTLRNASARDSLNVIDNLVGAGVQVTADDRTNSLIATGPKKELEILEALLIRLDEGQNASAAILKAYPLQHATSEKIVNTLNQLGLSATYSMDAEHRRLLVRGNEDAQKSVAEMLQTIDVGEPNAWQEPLQLRIVWLVEEKLAGKDAKDPAKNLERVVQTLNDRLDVTNLKMAAQLLVTIDPTKDDPNQTFTAHGTTSLQEGVSTRLEAAGQIVGQTGGTPTIQLSIEASQADQGPDRGFGGRSNTPSSRTLTSLTTKVMAPPGHSIVLGMTPIQSADSVFVLQLLSDEGTPDQSKPAPKN